MSYHNKIEREVKEIMGLSALNQRNKVRELVLGFNANTMKKERTKLNKELTDAMKAKQ